MSSAKPINTNKTVVVQDYDLAFKVKHGTVDLNKPALSQDGKRTLPKNDGHYREFVQDFKAAGLDMKRPVSVATFEQYAAKLRASLPKTSSTDFIATFQSQPNRKNFASMLTTARRLDADIQHGRFDKTGNDVQALRVALIETREKVIAAAEQTTNPKELRDLLTLGQALEGPSFHLSQTPDRYVFDARIINMQNKLLAPIPFPEEK